MLVFYLKVLLLIVNYVDGHSNFVAPPASESPFKKSAIVPYSVYQRNLEEQRLLNSESANELAKQLLDSESKEDPNTPVSFYLHPFEQANDNEISKADLSALSRGEPEGKSNSHETNQAYTTSSKRNPLPYHRSIFRPESNQIVPSTSTESKYQNSKPKSYFRPPPPSPSVSIRDRPKATVPKQSSNHHLENDVHPDPVFTNVAPAPYPSLSNRPTNNIVDNIFSQSQSNLRYAPPTSFAGLQPPIQPLVNPVNSMAGGQSNALEPLSALLGGGSPLETISKLTRTLLNIPRGNSELFNAVTKALGSNTVVEGSKLTSAALAKSSLDGQSSNETAEALLTSSFSSKESEKNATSALITDDLSEEQKALLQAAIANGELDGSANSAVPDVKIIKNNSDSRATNKIVDWIQQNRQKEGPVLSRDKLPYYGKYCGSLVVKNSSLSSNIKGAVWVVDEHRFIVSKFYFRPSSNADNFTFWAGPLKASNSEADFSPSSNGFYLEATPIEFNLFVTGETKTIESKIRKSSESSVKAEEAEETESSDLVNMDKNSVRRMRRGVPSLPLHFSTKSNGNNSVNLSITSAEASNDMVPEEVYSKQIKPLDWYAGVHPLMLTLPRHITINDIHWISVFDHTAQRSAASVLIPNESGFHIPASVTLRSFSANEKYVVSSGKIKVLDTKTIEIDNFTLRTKGTATWFMVGKDILPHKRGHILPVFNKTSEAFDCDSLPDYDNETVTLKLPGHLDIKDVFWFSVFSITKSVSLAHIYLPYNDLQLPPDLKGPKSPRCEWHQ